VNIWARSPSVFYRCFGFPIRFFAAFRFSFIVKLLTFCYTQLDFYLSSFQIYAQRHQRQAFFLRLPDELADFPEMQQKLTGSDGIMIFPVV